MFTERHETDHSMEWKKSSRWPQKLSQNRETSFLILIRRNNSTFPVSRQEYITLIRIDVMSAFEPWAFFLEKGQICNCNDMFNGRCSVILQFGNVLVTKISLGKHGSNRLLMQDEVIKFVEPKNMTGYCHVLWC